MTFKNLFRRKSEVKVVIKVRCQFCNDTYKSYTRFYQGKGILLNYQSDTRHDLGVCPNCYSINILNNTISLDDTRELQPEQIKRRHEIDVLTKIQKGLEFDNLDKETKEFIESIMQE
jgi:hypothetical protein